MRAPTSSLQPVTSTPPPKPPQPLHVAPEWRRARRSCWQAATTLATCSRQRVSDTTRGTTHRKSYKTSSWGQALHRLHAPLPRARRQYLREPRPRRRPAARPQLHLGSLHADVVASRFRARQHHEGHARQARERGRRRVSQKQLRATRAHALVTDVLCVAHACSPR